jgi:hypothetical protein
MKTKTSHYLLPIVLGFAAPASPPGLLAQQEQAPYVGEQENWYLAKEWSVPQGKYWGGAYGVAYRKDPDTGKELIYFCNGRSSSSRLSIYGMDGTPDSNVTGLYDAYDVAVDANGSYYVAERYQVSAYAPNGTLLWRTGKKNYAGDNAPPGSGSKGTGDGEFNQLKGITIGPSGDLFVADTENHRIQVLDRATGAFKRKFGAQGSAPGQFQYPSDLAFLPDGRLVVGDNGYLYFFKADGAFLSRKQTDGTTYLSVRRDGKILARNYLRDGEGEKIVELPFISSTRTVWTPNGDVIQGLYDDDQLKIRIWKRAYRTKGLPAPNVIPQPVVRAVAQRPGTNILDIDFEILDSDDATATAGIIAAVDGKFDDLAKWILPTAWAEGTESKIGTPIATNQLHRVSWYVKGDWTEQTGNLKFGVLCKDARRAKPVDLHFLELQLGEGALTISRSPVKDKDMVNYFTYLLATGAASVKLEYGEIKDASGGVLVSKESSSLEVSSLGRQVFMQAIGHRWAKVAETSLAREAATPGTVNQWEASNPVKPRNLPDKVNEYGFDVGNHGARAWWVVKASSLTTPDFTATAFDHNGSENDRFGHILATSGSRIVTVGSEDSETKSVYLYEFNESTGAIQAKGAIRPSNLDNSSQYFGHYEYTSLSMDGDLLAVGAMGAYVNDQYGVGATWLFDLSGSSPAQLNRITASDGTQSDQFGSSVDLKGNLLVVGAKGDAPNGISSAGAAYVFRRETDGSVTELAKLTDADAKAADYFGSAVAAGDGIVAVGSPGADAKVNGIDEDVGAVFLYKVDANGQVAQSAKLLPSYGYLPGAHFGNALDMSGNFLAVGSYRTYFPNTGWGVGTVHLYALKADGTAELTATILSPTPKSYGHFGWSVTMDGDRLVVGATGEDSESGSGSGVAYVYKVSADGKPTLLDRLLHPNGKAQDRLGQAVGVSGRNVVVGAPDFDLAGERWNAGSVVLFRSSR